MTTKGARLSLLLAGMAALASPLHAAEADAAAEAEAARGDDIIVRGQQLLAAANAGKSDTPVIEIPQAISIIGIEQIKVRGVTRLAEALRGVAGISRSSTYGFYDAYQIRGFDA